MSEFRAEDWKLNARAVVKLYRENINMLVSCLSVLLTQLNSANHPPKWVAYKGIKLKAYSYPQSLKRQSSFLLKFSTVLWCNNAADRLFGTSDSALMLTLCALQMLVLLLLLLLLFHASTILTEKKYLHISKWTCGLGLYTLSFLMQTLWLNPTVLHAEFNHIISWATADKLHLKHPEFFRLPKIKHLARVKFWCPQWCQD